MQRGSCLDGERVRTGSVRSRVESALALWRHENPQNKPPSISAICRLAGVSRANLYVHHPELLASIRKAGSNDPAPVKKSSPKRRPATDWHQEALNLDRKYKALLLVYLALETELRHLKAVVESFRAASSKQART